MLALLMLAVVSLLPQVVRAEGTPQPKVCCAMEAAACQGCASMPAGQHSKCCVDGGSYQLFFAVTQIVVIAAIPQVAPPVVDRTAESRRAPPLLTPPRIS